MKGWAVNFWKEHGERIIFMVVACSFGIGFIVYQPDGEIGASGRTILIGLAMLCYNKARGTRGDTK